LGHSGIAHFLAPLGRTGGSGGGGWNWPAIDGSVITLSREKEIAA